MLHNIRKEFGVSIVFVTHNLQIGETATRVITIKDGLLFKDQINETPIAANEMNWG